VNGRILALDPGERRIGLALSDPAGIIASPYAVLDRHTSDVAERLQQICRDEHVDRIVVGLPVTLDGREGAAASAARALAGLAAEATGLDVTLHDERFTTVTAEQALLEGGMRRAERRDVRDKVAAAVLLQSYLDGENQRRERTTGDNS
jgi:putative Holliday junction resolvase